MKNKKDDKKKKEMPIEEEQINNNEVELLGNRIKELEDNLLRSQAELINYKKRRDEEVSRLLKYANEDVIKEILPILDNFEKSFGVRVSVKANVDLSK